MNVDHQKYLHSINTKKVVATAAATTATATTTDRDTTTTFNVTTRRRKSISREDSNMSNSSMEGGGGGEYHAQKLAAVPFVWESSPGTPKRQIMKKSSIREFEHLIPPLTPPPSYQYRNNRIRPVCSSTKKKKQNDVNVNLIRSIFPRLSISSSSSSSSSPCSQSRSMTSNADSNAEVMEEEMVVDGGSRCGSPVSTLCFSHRRLSCCNGRFRGLYSSWF